MVACLRSLLLLESTLLVGEWLEEWQRQVECNACLLVDS